MATQRLKNLRIGNNIPQPPPLPNPNLEDFGAPSYEQDLSLGPPKKSLLKSNGFIWLLFTLVPAALTATALYIMNPSCIQDSTENLDYVKLVLFSAIAGVIGFIIKFFVFK